MNFQLGRLGGDQLPGAPPSLGHATPVLDISRSVDPLYPDVNREHWAKHVPQEPHRLMEQLETVLEYQVLDVS